MNGAEIGAALQLAGQRLAAGDHRGAEAPLRAVLRAAPQVVEAHFMLGVVSAMRGEHLAAIEAFDGALKVRPEFGQAMAQKARSLDALDRREDAVKLAEAAGRIALDPYSQDTLGVVMTRAGLHAKAAEYYGRAAKAAPAPGYHYNHASALQFLGRFEEAREEYRKCLARDPNHGPAWAGLVQITKQTKEKNEIATLSLIASKSAGDAQAVRVLGHALAKAYEDLGDYPHAMAWLEKAKAGMRARHDAAAEEALFAAAERSLGVAGGEGFAGARPIFVVGMPRTGTTLVERILSSHSEVTSAGELSDFPNALKAATGVRSANLLSPELIDAGAKANLGGVGRAYASRLSALGFGGRFVDKLPLNVFLAPLILGALPEARVICLRRHPADTVLSNYRQDFAEGFRHFDYAFDLEAAARYYVRFDAMARRFAGKLPADRYAEVRYEDVVGDLEGSVRRMLSFCGLEFEEACLRFEENAAPVATASAAQVRQPLYASSVGRWRKYRPGIDAALRVLVEGGVMEAGELG